MRHHQVKWAAMAVTAGLVIACLFFALVRM
jgi:hypothetical protein